VNHLDKLRDSILNATLMEAVGTVMEAPDDGSFWFRIGFLCCRNDAHLFREQLQAIVSRGDREVATQLLEQLIRLEIP